MSVPVGTPPQQRNGQLQAAALELLTIHREHMAREKRVRLYLIRISRDYGLSHEAIGNALGMTEAGVRMSLHRAEDA